MVRRRVSTDQEDGVSTLRRGKLHRIPQGRPMRDKRRGSLEQLGWEVEWDRDSNLGDTIESTMCRILIARDISEHMRTTTRGNRGANERIISQQQRPEAR